MRASPYFLATMYFLMGLAFVYLALQYADDTIWNFATIIFTIVATFDIGVAIRILTRYFIYKRLNKKE
ncbi:YdiK family protein [Piscibacillus salipiscarius]|uniref:YdiK family protein n=1 Tax=Piscibacillus salipiscarius TaxID=299480 RepID=A0ABW5Q862_9BACI|nr:YdiK family protein [Piscibacillus salipiscarius]